MPQYITCLRVQQIIYIIKWIEYPYDKLKTNELRIFVLPGSYGFGCNIRYFKKTFINSENLQTYFLQTLYVEKMDI